VENHNRVILPFRTLGFGGPPVKRATRRFLADAFSITDPSGETVIASGSADVAKSTGTGFCSDIVGISVDVPVAGSQPVTVVLRKGNVLGTGQIIWQGTIDTGVGHIDYTVGQSILVCPHRHSGFNVSVTNQGGATVHHELYGFSFGVQCCLVREGRDLRR